MGLPQQTGKGKTLGRAYYPPGTVARPFLSKGEETIKSPSLKS